MFLNPKKILDKAGVTGTFRVEPNALDFTLDDLQLITNDLFYFSNNKENVIHRNRTAVAVTDSLAIMERFGLKNGRRPNRNQDLGWLLEPNSVYDATSSVYIEVPENTAAVLVIRSTGNRNGITLTSGLYDSGFKGNIGFAIHTGNNHTFIEKGTFIGQVIFVEADSAGTYSGGYNTENGQHWTGGAIEQPAPAAPVVEPTPAPVVEAVVEPVVEAPVAPVVEAVVEAPVVEPAPITTSAPGVTPIAPAENKSRRIK
jgi:deoxycytidine triphosphate deaminase